MARTALTPQQITRAGLTPVLVAANVDGHSIANASGASQFLQVKNGSGADITVTFQTTKLFDGLIVEDLVMVVPATTGDKLIGPFALATFQQEDGSMYVDFSDVGSVTCALFQL